MAVVIPNASVDLPERQLLLTGLTCFSMLTPDESQELALLLQEKHFSSGDVIVKEDDIVDSVYIIATGQAEVTRNVMVKRPLHKAQVETQLLAVIGRSDSIGLNDTGFFSMTGLRTATVTCVKKVIALMLPIKELHQFLKSHPHLQSAMFAKTSEMLKVHLIKQTLPFVKLAYDRTRWLANQVQEVTIAAGDVIFKEGDDGDKCYLIRSGKVDIVTTHEDGSPRLLTTLKPPTLFGEATMITHDPRNASAIAAEKTELLVLEHAHLSELIETESNVAHMFMTLMVDRSRPLQNPNVSTHQRTMADGQEIVILKNPDNGNYFKLSREGWFIWQHLDGKQTMQAITMALANEYDIFAPDIVAALISKLAKGAFITNVAMDEGAEERNQTKTMRVLGKTRRLLEFQYAFGDADKWLSKVYDKGAYLLFTKPGKIILSLIAIIGFIVFLANTGSTIDTFKIMPNVWWIFLGMFPLMLISVALHELGHALATKSYGFEVHYMGVGWFWTTPVAFTDTSDMWLSSKGPRTVVNLAGVFTDCLVAGVSGILIVLIDNPYIEAFLWFFALYTYINAFRMLSPLQELDGYYVLMDLVDKPNLRQASVLWLVRRFPKALVNPKLFKRNLQEVYYWLACIVYIVLVSMLTWFVQTVVLKMLGFHVSNPYLSLCLPLLIACVSAIGVIGDIRNQTD